MELDPRCLVFLGEHLLERRKFLVPDWAHGLPALVVSEWRLELCFGRHVDAS